MYTIFHFHMGDPSSSSSTVLFGFILEGSDLPPPDDQY